jgi:ABC-type transport system involved in multi-copper enzyme maturation permease subunit
MTATVSTVRTDVAGRTASAGMLAGFGGLFRKELMEWRRARRTWIVLLVSGAFMTLSALNSWLQSVLPADVTEGAPAPIFDPMANLGQGVASQIFVVAAIFAVMALITAERESGTLAWTASKPVSRSAIWLSKLVASSAVLWVVAAIVPLVATVALVLAIYGPLPVMPLVIIAVGMGMATALYIAVALAASTVVTSQAAVAGIAIGFMFLPQLLGLVVPSIELMPQSILVWSIMTAVGEPAGFLTVVSWAVTVAALVAFSFRRMERMEL